ncbi:hypothetical protein Tco_0854021 [Tanacetum coccineum]
MIAPSSFRYSSNDIEEAKKKTQKSGRNSRPSVMPSAGSQSTTNDSKPKPRIYSIIYPMWKQPGRIFNTVGLRWVPTGKIFTSSTTTVDSELPNGFNTNITNLHECIQNLDSSAGTSISVQEEQTLGLNTGTPFNLKKERIKVWIKENVIYPSVSKSSALSDNLQQHDTQPTTNIHPTLEPIIPPSNNNVEDNK